MDMQTGTNWSYDGLVGHHASLLPRDGSSIGCRTESGVFKIFHDTLLEKLEYQRTHPDHEVTPYDKDIDVIRQAWKDAQEALERKGSDIRTPRWDTTFTEHELKDAWNKVAEDQKWRPYLIVPQIVIGGNILR